MAKRKTLLDEYRFPGFRPKARVRGIFGDPKARIVCLERTGKKRCAEHAVRFIGLSTIARVAKFETFRAGMFESLWTWRSAG